FERSPSCLTIHTRSLSFKRVPHPRATLFPYTTLFRSEGQLIDTLEYESKEGIVSEETSRTMNTILEKVVSEGSGKNAYIEGYDRSEEHTSELQSRFDLVCRLLLEKKKKQRNSRSPVDQ